MILSGPARKGRYLTLILRMFPMLIKPGIWFPWVPDPFEFSLLGSIPSIQRADGGFLKIVDPDQTFDFLDNIGLENEGSETQKI